MVKVIIRNDDIASNKVIVKIKLAIIWLYVLFLYKLLDNELIALLILIICASLLSLLSLIIFKYLSIFTLYSSQDIPSSMRPFLILSNELSKKFASVNLV